MALTDENVQELQVDILKIIKEKGEGGVYETSSGIRYKIINEVNEITQAIAVAPMIGKNKVDYTQTTIVVAGTQDPDGDINNHVIESGFNAATARVQLTEQTKSISKSKWKVNKMVFIL